MQRLHAKLGACLLFSALAAKSAGAADIALHEDGWHRWQVPAGPRGLRACCYEVRSGVVRRAACRLGDGMNEFSPSDDCAVRSDVMQIFVEVRAGRVRGIRALFWLIQSDSDEAYAYIDRLLD